MTPAVMQHLATIWLWREPQGITPFGLILICGLGLLLLLWVIQALRDRSETSVEAWNQHATVSFPALERLIALGIDVTLFGVPIWYAGQFLSPIRFESPALGPLHGNLNFGFSSPTSTWGWAVLLLALPLPYAAFEAIFGATPGKFFAGLRVVNRAGNKPSWIAVCIRNLLRPFDMSGWLIVAGISMFISKYNQRVGDRAAHTYVVRRDALTWPSDRSRDWVRAWGTAIAIILVTCVSLVIDDYVSPPSLVLTRANVGGSWSLGSGVTVPTQARLAGLTVSGPFHEESRVLDVVHFKVRLRGRTRACRLQVQLRWPGGIFGQNPLGYLFGRSGWEVGPMTYMCLGQRLTMPGMTGAD